MNLTCGKVRALLPERHDGSLATAAAAAVAGHLSSCGGCSREARAYESSLSDLYTFGTVEPRRNLWPGIASRIGASAFDRESGAAGWFGRLWDGLPRPLAPRAAFGVAILVAGVVLGIFLKQITKPVPAAVPTQAPMIAAVSTPQNALAHLAAASPVRTPASPMFQGPAGLGVVAVEHEGPSAIQTPPR